MALTGDQERKLHHAILLGFDGSELAELVRFHLEKRLDQINKDGPVVLELIEWTERNGRTESLIKAVRLARPNNQQIQSLTEALKGSETRTRPEFDPRHKIPWLRLCVATVASLALLAVIIYFVTDYGTVKIKGTDANMEVRIDSKKIRIENIGEPIALHTGPHELQVTLAWIPILPFPTNRTTLAQCF
jgi:hypothetical protein